MMQEETTGLCHAVASNRYQQVFLACCWVVIVSHFSSLATDTCVLHVLLRPQKSPLERLSSEEWLTPN